MSHLVTMRPPTIKNKAANPIQISAEQLLKDTQIHAEKQIIKQDERIRDEDELNELKLIKRKEFELKVQRARYHTGNWIKYAQWEEQLQEYRRARSIFERCLEIDAKNPSVWMKYIEMEMRHKFLNHARNLFERVIEVHPRNDQFWYKYAYLEEILGNYVKARQIFQQWMEWRPQEKAWLAYVQYEGRMHEPENQREIMYKYMDTYPQLKVYMKVAQFEIKLKNVKAARKIYERTIEDLGQQAIQQDFFIEFAKFEKKNKEYERAREIYKFGLAEIPKDQSKKLYEEYLSFEKQFGQKDEIDDLVLNQRRTHYKDLIAKNKLNYDAWFDLVNLEISSKNINRTRETFEAAVANVPLIEEKRYWRRYIYLWHSYAAFEELEAQDIERTKQIFERILKVVPHAKFTFTKIWVNYAHFYIRCSEVEKARKIFGIAIGKCANEKIFSQYIEMELQLVNIDRVRQIYEKFVELFPDNALAWIKWAELERSIDEIDRFRALFEIAVNNPQMSQPETVWKAYIDNEISQQDFEKVRDLYERLLDRSKHIKIWISFAQLEASIEEAENCRKILKRAEQYYIENSQLKEERAMLLEVWKDLEIKFNDQTKIKEILEKQPTKVKKQRKIQKDDADEVGQEEYIDYVFPGDSKTKNIQKMLEKAHKWKQQNEQK